MPARHAGACGHPAYHRWPTNNECRTGTPPLLQRSTVGYGAGNSAQLKRDVWRHIWRACASVNGIGAAAAHMLAEGAYARLGMKCRRRGVHRHHQTPPAGAAIKRGVAANGALLPPLAYRDEEYGERRTLHHRPPGNHRFECAPHGHGTNGSGSACRAQPGSLSHAHRNVVLPGESGHHGPAGHRSQRYHAEGECRRARRARRHWGWNVPAATPAFGVSGTSEVKRHE